MKKVLLTLLAVFMAVPAFAIEVYNNGDNSVAIYGTIRGYLGYGFGQNPNLDISAPGISSPTGADIKHNMLYGLQGNSRIGTNFTIGSFSGQVELGANEKTYLKQNEATVGLRQAWGAYTFGNGSKLVVGKTDTPTAMGGFISDMYDTDGGLKGYGGTVTGVRRFQIQYSIAGLTLALIEDDLNNGNPVNIAGFDDNAPYTPRAGISYTFKNDSLTAKVAATYTAVNGSYTKAGDTSGKLSWTNLHAFGVTFGVKPTFGNMWLSVLARYGMNEDLYGEGSTVAFNQEGYGHTNYVLSLGGLIPGEGINLGRTFNSKDGSFNNTHRAGAALEFGMKATENFTAIVGAGYQATIQEMPEIVSMVDPSYLVHSYAVFLQGQYAFSPNFAIVPQIAWYGTVGKASATVGNQKIEITDPQNGLLVGAQFRVTF